LDECGLPKKMALELFKPFVINKLVEREIVHNIRAAGRLIEEAPNIVWAILEEVIQNRYVLLNRAPTLHRLGIQAFKPVLIEGLAIRIHPLVCTAFNADFDGDQMAVHLPLTEEAQAEAKNIMLSSLNLLKPATGDPIVDPSKDIVFGCYYMSRIIPGLKGEGKIFGSVKETILAYQFGEVDLKAKIRVRVGKTLGADSGQISSKKKKAPSNIIETCVGRLIFNDILPADMPFINEELKNKVLSRIVAEVIERYGTVKSAEILDAIKKLGFEYATQSGLSWGMDDLQVPKEKKAILTEGEAEVKKIIQHYEQGLLTEEERKDRIIGVWHRVVEKIKKVVLQSLLSDSEGPVYSFINSKARGTEAQLIQMTGIKGLVANPAGETIELPIKNSYKEGLNVLEYFIATHGARKGTADTALRTASAGYLTRRLVDVSQDIKITEEDCGETQGFEILRSGETEFTQSFATRIFSRAAAQDVINPETKKILVKKGEIIDKKTSQEIENQKIIDKAFVRSPMTCQLRKGICQKCYGYDLGNNRLVNIGEAVGIVAAQAIGEPGTQLTMRTFHTGGMAGGIDITQGLPRVQEIFEVRIPKGKAVISETAGTVEDIEDNGKQKIVKIRVISSESKPKTKKTKKAAETKEYTLPSNVALFVKIGDKVEPGTQLCEGNIDLKELFKSCGSKRVRHYILDEIQKIYTSQGAPIHNKHIEIIVRQMFSRVKVKESGASSLTPGEIIEKSRFLEINHELLNREKKPAKAIQLLLGITKVALTTQSFLSAASFQETARILITAACEGREDKLYGLKENVIIGRLIPAGTGFRRSQEKTQKTKTEENLET
ncbi:MAG: DNA-directed RNA polymerase subunit beta', partial [bacterium]|nr:DNA-directed RNA polymerase subunit beta' [bacterium]